jgi:hypothetical protein
VGCGLRAAGCVAGSRLVVANKSPAFGLLENHEQLVVVNGCCPLKKADRGVIAERSGTQICH